ncbi:MAG TPA: membrane dipeptidase [Bacteriovoracaceae bacterium]|nr:membrane dipeptidase [Bacteriovoracaceae bacterium]
MKQFILWISLLIVPNLAFCFGVDLHAHLFMEQGVNIIYNGGFFLPHIKAKKWNHAKRSQVNENLMKQTELSIVVVSLYAAPIIAGESVFNSILKQIKMAEIFVERNPNGVITHSSTDAQSAINQGKKILVFSIEGGDRNINTLEQLKILHSRGVRIITLLHLTGDKIGGPTLAGRMEALFSTPSSLFCYGRDSEWS